MTDQEFLDKVGLHAISCKELSEGNGGYNIKRGMARVMSGYVEDLFALYLAKRINRHDLSFLVDKATSIRFSKNGKATTFKPDISIVNNDHVVTHYYDLKTNLGWQRDLKDYLKNKSVFIDKIKGRPAWIHYSKENIQEIRISPNIKYKMVVIDGGNINKNQLAENIRLAQEYENIELYILNRFQEDKTHIINSDDFIRLHSNALELCSI